MNEVGTGIVADASGPQVQGGASQLGEFTAGETNIGSLAGQMKAFFRYAVTGLTQLAIGGRASVAGNDLVGPLIVGLFAQGEKQIEELGVDGLDQIGAMVAQQVIDVGQRLWQIVSVGPVDNRLQALSCVGVVQGEASFPIDVAGSAGQTGQRQSQAGCAKQARFEESASVEGRGVKV